MLTRSQSFPARTPIPRKKRAVFEEKTELVYKDGLPETKRVNKKLCFLVYNKGIMEWWSIDEFLDGMFFGDKGVFDWINYKNQVARDYPNVKRRCFMCTRFALKGQTICYAYHVCGGLTAKSSI